MVHFAIELINDHNINTVEYLSSSDAKDDLKIHDLYTYAKYLYNLNNEIDHESEDFIDKNTMNTNKLDTNVYSDLVMINYVVFHFLLILFYHIISDHEGDSESSINCKSVTESNDHLLLAPGSDGDGRDNDNNNIMLNTSTEENEDGDDHNFIPRVVADFLSSNSGEHQLANWLSKTDSHIPAPYISSYDYIWTNIDISNHNNKNNNNNDNNDSSNLNIGNEDNILKDGQIH